MDENPVTIPKGQISILAGASGAGKTTLLMQAISSWAKGEVLFPEFTWAGEKGLAYIAADRPIKEVIDLSKRLGINEEKVEFYGLVDDKTVTSQLLSSPMVLFKFVLSKITRPFDILVLDPIGIFVDGSINNYNHVARTLIPMNQMACEKDITIIATHHARKARTDFKYSRPQDRIAGSTAFLGYSGTQMVLVPGAEEGVREDVLYIVPHTMESSKVFMERGQDGLLRRVEVGPPPSEEKVKKFPDRKQRT